MTDCTKFDGFCPDSAICNDLGCCRFSGCGHREAIDADTEMALASAGPGIDDSICLECQAKDCTGGPLCVAYESDPMPLAMAACVALIKGDDLQKAIDLARAAIAKAA